MILFLKSYERLKIQNLKHFIQKSCGFSLLFDFVIILYIFWASAQSKKKIDVVKFYGCAMFIKEAFFHTHTRSAPSFFSLFVYKTIVFFFLSPTDLNAKVHHHNNNTIEESVYLYV